MQFNNYSDKLVGILGLARSGLSSARSLLKGGAHLIIWDDNNKALTKAQEELAHLSSQFLVAPPHDQAWRKACIFLVSPGIPMYYPNEHPLYRLSIEENIPLCCDIELFCKQLANNSTIVGITGTNGKSTTAALINHVLNTNNIKSNLGGNIGIPVADLPENKGEFYIIEASSFQLDLMIEAKFDIAICLSITPDHFDRHGTFKRYVESKTRIFHNQGKKDFAIISVTQYTNAQIMDIVGKNNKSRIIPISTSDQIDGGISVISGILYNNYRAKKRYDVSEIENLAGEHNGENMAAAFAACLVSGLHPDKIISSFKTYKALPHRAALFHKHGNVNFINDSKATNASSTYWALKTYDNIYWIAGGIPKDGGIKLLKPFFEKINHAYLIGEAAESFSAILTEHGVANTIATTLVNAISIMKSHNIIDGNVLLSPACSSLDQWNSYEERGNAFMQMVRDKWQS